MKGPNEPGHYAILDIPEIGKELVISWSSDEGKSNSNPRNGALYAFDTCYDRLIQLKAKPLGLINCLNFGHPQDSIGAFAQTIEALAERCQSKKVPVVGGNVSLYNASKNSSIKPTPVFVIVGIR